MRDLAIVYWSATGNTEAMAVAVAEGARSTGAQVRLMTAAEALAPTSWLPATASPLAAPLWAPNSWRRPSLSLCSLPAKAS